MPLPQAGQSSYANEIRVIGTVTMSGKYRLSCFLRMGWEESCTQGRQLSFSQGWWGSKCLKNVELIARKEADAANKSHWLEVSGKLSHCGRSAEPQGPPAFQPWFHRQNTSRAFIPLGISAHKSQSSHQSHNQTWHKHISQSNCWWCPGCKSTVAGQARSLLHWQLCFSPMNLTVSALLLL